MIIRGLSGDDELLSIFLTDLKENEKNIFKPTIVIVPNLSFGSWLKDQITNYRGITANIKFVELNQFINKIYNCNNKEVELIELSAIKYLIYDFLCSCDLSHQLFTPIKNGLFTDNHPDKDKIFQFSTQLERIFIDYLYLRTEELLQDRKFLEELPSWQSKIFQSIIKPDTNKKNFLDIYSYFIKAEKINTFHNNIYIYGLANVYISQLQILNKISSFTRVRWYYIAISFKYYHDLLDERTKDKLRRKILKEPTISVDELCLMDGNLLTANLGIKSREFNEIALANDTNMFDIHLDNKNDEDCSTLLKLVQSDIKQLIYRIEPLKRPSNDSSYQAAPILLKELHDDSIIINICHNKMREVQIAFNNISEIILNIQNINLSDIVVVAPNINEYKTYINAVFSNEYLVNTVGDLVKIPYHICGFKYNHDKEIEKIILSLLKLNYKLKVRDVFEILNHSKVINNFSLTRQDIHYLHKWITDNNIHFGFDTLDTNSYGYENFDLFTFSKLLKNLVLGVAIPSILYNNSTPENIDGFPYDNLEFGSIDLYNKLAQIITFLQYMRKLFYIDEYNYQPVSIKNIIDFFSSIKNGLLFEDNDATEIDKIINHLSNIKINHCVTLPIVVAIIEEYFKPPDERLNQSGKLTFASMNTIKNIPYKVVYIMGMDYGEFPRLHYSHKLSMLHKNASFADINTTIEDKQLFLDIILTVKDKLYISYKGINESDNSDLNPSILLKLFIQVLEDSVLNKDFVKKYVIKKHPLHTFNKLKNHDNQITCYSNLWNTLNVSPNYKNLHWDFANQNQLKLDSKIINITIAELINAFQSNNNIKLSKTLGIYEYKTIDKLSNDEILNISNRRVIQELYKELEMLFNNFKTTDQKKLFNYLSNKGLAAYGTLGHYQFNEIYNKFITYKNLTGTIPIEVEYSDNQLLLKDKIFTNSKGEVWVVNDFIYYINESVSSIKYHLKIKGLIYLLILNTANITLENTSKVNLIVDKVFIKPGFFCDNYTIIRFKDQVNVNHLLKQVMDFYINSLIHPTFICHTIMDEAAKYFDKLSNNSIMLKKLLTSSIKDKFKEDRIFHHNNLKDYFDKVPLKQNSIFIISSLLTNIDISSSH